MAGEEQQQGAAALPLGVFDSGVGGLTVLRAIRDRLPDEEIFYLGDTARVPYGNRSAETVRRYALNAASHLVERRVKALVVACNTGLGPRSRYAGARLGAAGARGWSSRWPGRRRRPRAPVRSPCSVPGPPWPVAATRSRCAGLTRRFGSVRSPARCSSRWPRRAGFRARWVDEVASHYLQALRGTETDTVILGCTHYPILRHAIAQAIEVALPGGQLSVLDSAEATARDLAEMLAQRGLRRPSDCPQPGGLRYLVTDDPQGFVRIADRFFGASVEDVQHVDL